MVDQTNLEQKLGMKITSLTPIPGGSVGECYHFEDSFGESFFVKANAPKKDMLIKEALGLELIEKTQTLKTPKIHYVDKDILVLELVKAKEGTSEGFKLLGKTLAEFHLATKSKTYGFTENNYIGRAKQINGSYENWAEFFFDKRLLVQFQLAQQNKLITEEFQKNFLQLQSKIQDILKEIEEPACLVHGDLWSGNVLFDRFNKPIVIDPAVYYGNREVDLAMTQLFGGFPSEFYEAYKAVYPLQPGYQKRFYLYNLYHLLNHLNLFGSSYFAQCELNLGHCLK